MAKYEKSLEESGIESTVLNEFKEHSRQSLNECSCSLDDDYETGIHVYMGYVLCYSLAVADYESAGGMLKEKLDKWLPPSDYINKAPLCLALANNGVHYDRENFLM